MMGRPAACGNGGMAEEGDGDRSHGPRPESD